MDADHNRSVITFAGSPRAVAEAAVRGVIKAVELIDLTRHEGVHPRVGAADVVPFVPVEGVTLKDCVELAHLVGEEIWAKAGVPVYFYEAAAKVPDRVRLENVRRGQFERLREEVRTIPARRPDVGLPELHPTAGATVVGARKFLIAYNVNLATSDVSVASRIARKIRASSGGFQHVKALGLTLASRGQVQVSMNLTDYELTPMHVVYEAIRREAALAGVDVADSEIVGLIPRTALEEAARAALRIDGFHPSVVLENRIADVLPTAVSDFLEELANPRGFAYGLGAAAIAGAAAASLGLAVSRRSKLAGAVFEAMRTRLVDRIEPGAVPARDLRTALVASVEVAEQSCSLRSELACLADSCLPAARGDALTAVGLASAAVMGAIASVRQMLESCRDRDLRAEVESRIRSIE
jgi:glutamate formiminotransferase